MYEVVGMWDGQVENIPALNKSATFDEAQKWVMDFGAKYLGGKQHLGILDCETGRLLSHRVPVVVTRKRAIRK